MLHLSKVNLMLMSTLIPQIILFIRTLKQSTMIKFPKETPLNKQKSLQYFCPINLVSHIYDPYCPVSHFKSPSKTPICNKLWLSRIFPILKSHYHFKVIKQAHFGKTLKLKRLLPKFLFCSHLIVVMIGNNIASHV